jgi:hypothetical protein
MPESELEGLRIRRSASIRAQLGNLYVLLGRFDEAEREFNHADYVFPAHPQAMNGRVRLLIARIATLTRSICPGTCPPPPRCL